MKKQKIHIFTHSDLDGFTSYMLVKWAFPKDDVTYTSVDNALAFRDKFTSWLVNNKVEDFYKIFILDLDVSNSYEEIDFANITIIDHHKSQVDFKSTLKKATLAVKEYSSASKMIYKIFEKLYKLKLNKDQKALVALTDDYDCYALTSPLSSQLNIVFWATNKRFDVLSKLWDKGFMGFDLLQRNKIIIHFTNLRQLIPQLKIYKGSVIFDGGELSVIATFAKDMINDVSDYLLKKYNMDISIVVNVEAKRVYFRSNVEDVDLSILSKELCGEFEAGGHFYAAGGKLTDLFLDFTKELTPINEGVIKPNKI
jgi:uncharacterized protein